MIRIVRGGVALGGWILVGIFAGGYLAYYVNPTAAWWMQVLALALPVVVIALVPVTLLAVLIRRRALTLACMLALLLFGARHAPFGLLHATRAADGDVLRILTYNTHGAKGYEAHDGAGVRRLVEETSPDIVCLQEFAAPPGSTPRGSILRSLSESGYHIAAALPEGLRRYSARPVLSRFPVREVRAHSLTARPDGYAVHAVIDAPSGVVDVFNVHLVGLSPRRPWRDGDIFDPRDWLLFFRSSSHSYVMRSRESLALRALLADRERPAIVCGDFNATSNQWTYRHAAAGMKDAFRIAGRGWGKTYHARLPLVRIDYVLASDEWRVISAEVRRGADSDHRAVVAELSPDTP